MSQLATRPGGRILVDQLLKQGIDRVFCVPGESYLPVLDALHDRREIEVVTCRQEGGAAMMAEAHGKLSGRPGVCLVTRGPGASNASIGVHIARQDSSPMLLLIGQVGRGQSDRESFQEVDLVAMFRPLAKWAAQVESADRLPEYISRACHLACNGRPGPVVLSLPEDMLRDAVSVPDLPAATHPRPYPDPEAMARLQELLAESQAPLLILGPVGAWDRLDAPLQQWAQQHWMPVATAFRCQDAFDNEHPTYWGHAGLGMDPQLATAIREADLLLVVGTRIDEITSGAFALIAAPQPSQKLVHVYPDAGELGRVCRPQLAIQADAGAFIDALSRLQMPLVGAREHRTRRGHQRFLEFTTPTVSDAPLDPAVVIATLREHLPEDAVVSNGAGNYAIWLHRYFRYRAAHTQLAPRAGAMGYGLPAAIAAKAMARGRRVVALAGDGCLMMTVQELATLVQHKLSVIVIVFNNAGFGTIRMHQERHYPGRSVATALVNPDFVALGQSFGLRAWRAETNQAFEQALVEALAADQPALIEVRTDPRMISPGARLKSGGGLEVAHQPR